MGGWGCGGTLVSKGFGYPNKIDYCGYDEYPPEVPTVILDGYETLDFEEKNEFSITVYNLQNKTKCVYYVKPEKEYIPYNERDIERYINMPNENLYPTRYSEWCSENEKTSSETKDCDDGLPF